MKTKRFLIFFLSLAMLFSLATLCGCADDGQDLDGLYVVDFQFNGGILDNGATLVEEKISHAYPPNSLAIDISKFKGYTFKKAGYVFEGWYTDEGLTDAWNFSLDLVSANVTLYAKWVKAIVYSYEVYLVGDGGSTTLLGSYTVKQGDAFSDISKKYTTSVLQETYGKTCVGLYSSADLLEQNAWDGDYRHPGGETDTAIPVYVKAIEGVWELVADADKLLSVAGQDKNIYLTDNIDCGGRELYFRDYNSIFNGNGYTISNVKVPDSSRGGKNRKYSLFGILGENGKICDVTFDGVRFEFEAYKGQSIFASALAQEAATGFEISNVTVSGSYTATAKAAEVLDASKLNQALYDNTNQTSDNITGFTSTIILDESN